ncbi:hypothetical protein X975_06128, partial [Stegodyphus mimosarum]
MASGKNKLRKNSSGIIQCIVTQFMFSHIVWDHLQRFQIEMHF